MMQVVGQSWLVYRLTHSSAYLGAINFSQQIPILLLGLLAGGLVDRINRHRLVIITQTAALIQAAVLWALTYWGIITIPTLFVLAVILGVINAFDLPARQAFLIQMVSRQDLANGIALNSSLFNAARVVGPAIAGLVVRYWGESPCFLINAVSFLFVIAALFMMRITATPGDHPKTWSSEFVEGVRYVFHTAPIRVMLQLLGALGIAGFPFTVLLPIFADRIFLRGASGYGWLLTAAGIGALSGALFLATRKSFYGIGRLIAACSILFSVCLMLFAMSTHFALTLVLLILIGFFMMVTIACVNTAIQSIIPDHLRGRVMSFFTTTLIGSAPIGSLMAGWVAKYFGVQITVFSLAVICLGAALWFLHSLPAIKTEARRLYQLQNPPVPPIPE
jgi:MFS family permease